MFGSPGSPAKSVTSSQSQSQSTRSLDKFFVTSPSFPHDYESVSRPDSRLADALCARDLLASRLITACASIQQKALVIERLETETTALQQTVAALTTKKEELEEKLAADLQKATKALAIRPPGREVFEQPPGYDDAMGRAGTSTGASTPRTVFDSPGPMLPTSESHSVFKTASDPEERLKARYELLASLPLPECVPDDELKPLILPGSTTIKEFILSACNLQFLRNGLSNYRILQELTTAWCPDREEHGFMLTPIFKCITNPRTVTAHSWNPVDVIGPLANPTECFYSKDGKWYYAGTYQAVRLQDLIPEEWNNLSSEAMQVIIKETLAGRKNLSAQNNYETSQLYAAGALKVACIGLQCVGFNEGLYRGLLDHAAACVQGTVKRRAGLGPGAAWNIQANSSPSPTSSPGMGGFSKQGIRDCSGGIRGNENYTGVVTF